MKKVFFVLVVAILAGANVFAQINAEREFFDNIPNQKSITISGYNTIYVYGYIPDAREFRDISDGGLNWKMTINDDYKVSFSANRNANVFNRDQPPSDGTDGWIRDHRDTWVDGVKIAEFCYTNRGISIYYDGTGYLEWDDSNEKIKIVLDIDISGQCAAELRTLEYDRKGKLVGRIDDEITAEGSTSTNVTFVLQMDNNQSNSSNQVRFRLSKNKLTLKMEGYFIGVGGTTSFGTTPFVEIGGDTWHTAVVVPKN